MYCWVAIFLASFSFHTQSQTAYSLNILPLGDKEALMANTGTGGINSTGAAFYNPAALTQLKGNSFSFSGAAFMNFDIEVDPITRIGGEDLNYSANGFQSIPSSMVALRSFGNWKVAFSVMIPDAFQFDGPTTWKVNLDGGTFNMRVQQNFKEQLFLAGLSAARKINEYWSLGISAYGQVLNFSSEVFLKGRVEGLAGAAFIQTTRTDVKPRNALIVLGVLREWEHISWGGRIALPSIHLFGKGSYYNYEFDGFSAIPIEEEVNVTESGLNYYTPLEFRSGLSMRPNEKWLLTIDGAYALPYDYKLFNDPRVDQRLGLVSNARVSGAVQRTINDGIQVMLGMNYVPATEKEGDFEYSEYYIGNYGGVKLLSEHVETSLGFFHAIGFGTAQQATSDVISDERFRYYGLFLGTSYRF